MEVTRVGVLCCCLADTPTLRNCSRALESCALFLVKSLEQAEKPEHFMLITHLFTAFFSVEPHFQLTFEIIYTNLNLFTYAVVDTVRHLLARIGWQVGDTEADLISVVEQLNPSECVVVFRRLWQQPTRLFCQQFGLHQVCLVYSSALADVYPLCSSGNVLVCSLSPCVRVLPIP